MKSKQKNIIIRKNTKGEGFEFKGTIWFDFTVPNVGGNSIDLSITSFFLTEINT